MARKTLNQATTETCPKCGAEHTSSLLSEQLELCPSCFWHFPMGALERISHLADPQSFKELDRGLASVDPLQFSDLKSYRERLSDARARTGLREGVVVGEGKIGGRRAIFTVLDFSFMGGSMGSVVGEKIARAFERATSDRLPLVAVSTSGGARMQEGMLSLMQMAKTAAAASRHHMSGLLFVSILTNPTTGGIAASFSALGDVILAEPGALVGFAGPRVVEQTIGEKLPPDSHKAEFLLSCGMIDMIVDRRDLRKVVMHLISHFTSGNRRSNLRDSGHGRKSFPIPPAWETIQLARHPERPTSGDFMSRIFTNFVELHGDRRFGDDPAVIGGLGDLDGEPVVIIGQECGRGGHSSDCNKGMAYPEGYRKALRLMGLASKFHLPLITFVDTPGAHPGYEAQKRGIAGALAENLASMAGLPTPVISVVIGEGGSGGALALAVGDRVLMLQNAVYSVISPEGAAAILYRDAGRAREIAPSLKLTAPDLFKLKVIDEIVEEPSGGAHRDPEGAARQLKEVIIHHLQELRRVSSRKLVEARYDKYRNMGKVGKYWQEYLKQEIRRAWERIHPKDKGQRPL
ncbi:MAG: acetyl-CoA carboxylase carboxyltransferase subunit alpha [Armatimonadetes bacterium]|nr:acetyl-CoA carboxylase carboxyltransferase subunit alpha [Armatimonadota bacterium]